MIFGRWEAVAAGVWSAAGRHGPDPEADAARPASGAGQCALVEVVPSLIGLLSPLSAE